MKNLIIALLRAVMACLVASVAHAQEDTPFTRLFDTIAPSAEVLPEVALAKLTGWQLIPEDTTNHQFSGDAVVLNDKLAVMLRKQGHGTEVYSKTSSGLKHRASLGHVTTSSAAVGRIDTLRIIENTSGAVMMEAASQNPGSAALRFRLTTGEAILEIRPDAGTGFVDVQTKSRYVVVPDYFGDDMVFGPDAFKGLALPAENICLNLIEGNDAIIMNVWQSSEQDAWLCAPINKSALCSSRISCLKGKSIWLAFLESPGIWHPRNASTSDDWKPPFPAKWRCSQIGENSTADSWDLERGPLNSSRSGRREEAPIQTRNPQSAIGNGQSLLTSAATIREGSSIIYPMDRSSATPLTASCPTDVMRNTLGVGPCQYILACEGLGAQGDPTPNSVMNWVEKQFEQKKEKKMADDIKERLDIMAEHVIQAKGRIERYAAFCGQVGQKLATQPNTDTIRGILDDLDRYSAAGMTAAASPDRAKQLASEVKNLIGKPDSLAGCKALGEQLRSLGALQDRALARCRMAVRRLRQQGRTIADAPTPEPGLTQDVQRLAEQMLQKK